MTGHTQWIRWQCGYLAHPAVLRMDWPGRLLCPHLVAWQKTQGYDPSVGIDPDDLDPHAISRLMGGMPAETVREALDDIARVGLMTTEDGRVYIVGWETWQADPTAAERKRRSRGRHGSHGDARDTRDVTPPETPDPPVTDVTVTSRCHGDWTGPDGTGQDRKKKPSSTSEDGKSTGDGGGDAVRFVFDHWKSAFAKRQTVKLGQKRRAKIQSRLRDGYSVEDLCAAIDGQQYDPHLCGANDRGTVYDDIVTILRDEAITDRLIGYARDPSTRPDPGRGQPATAAARSAELHRPRWSEEDGRWVDGMGRCVRSPEERDRQSREWSQESRDGVTQMLRDRGCPQDIIDAWEGGQDGPAEEWMREWREQQQTARAAGGEG